MAKHLNTEAAADSGLSYIRDALVYGWEPKHAAPMTYNDPWAGNPDTDKYWSK